MSATLYAKIFLTARIDGHDMSAGSSDTLLAIELTGEAIEIVNQLASQEVWTVWDASTAAINDFAVLAVVTSVDMDIELTTDIDGGANTRIYTLSTRANIPFIVPKNRSYSGYVENFAGGTVDKIERVRIKNVSTDSGSARFLLFL